MSGLEALGIAASIIQVADLGTKLSVKLFSFYRELKGANESIQNLSSDVAITSAILRELGESLKEDEQAKLYSKTAFETLKDVLTQCEEVLEQIRGMTKYNDSSEKTRLQQITERFRQVLLEPSLDPLKANLKRLKSTMLLLLNVIMYAGQIRSNNVPAMPQEQRDFIKCLLEEKQKNDAQIMATPNHVTINMSVDSHVDPWRNGDSTKGEPSDLDEYSLLMQKMLQEINSCKNRLEQNRHSRIRSGVLNIHSREILQFQLQHGQSIIQRFDHSLFVEEVPVDPRLKISPSLNTSPRPLDDGFRDVPSAFGSIAELDSKAPTDTREGDGALLECMAPYYPRISKAAKRYSRRPSISPAVSLSSQSSTSNLSEPLDPIRVNASAKKVIHSYKCTHPGCTASPFETQFLLTFHAEVHSQDRPDFCPAEGCPCGQGDKGSKRTNEMMHDGLIHGPGYMCPFCPANQHDYPELDSLLGHVRTHHPGKSMEDPILRQAISTHRFGSGRDVTKGIDLESSGFRPSPRHRRPGGLASLRPAKRINLDNSGFRPQDVNCPPRRKLPGGSASLQPVSRERDGTISLDNGNTQALPSVDNALGGLHDVYTPPPPPAIIISPQDIELEDIPKQTFMRRRTQHQRPPLRRELDRTDKFDRLVLEWTNLTREELSGITG